MTFGLLRQVYFHEPPTRAINTMTWIPQSQETEMCQKKTAADPNSYLKVLKPEMVQILFWKQIEKNETQHGPFFKVAMYFFFYLQENTSSSSNVK